MNPFGVAPFTDPLMVGVFWFVVALFLLVVGLMATIIGVRVNLWLKDVLEERFAERWEHVWSAGVDILGVELPKLNSWETAVFVKTWLENFQEGDEMVQMGLEGVAQLTELPKLVTKQLRYGFVKDKLVALTLAGLLGDKQIWDDCQRLAKSRDTLLSLTAIRAMMAIDSEEATPFMLGQMLKRADWPLAWIKMILVEAGPEVITKPVYSFMNHISPKQVPILVPYLHLIQRPTAVAILEQQLCYAKYPPTILECLRVLLKVKPFHNLNFVRRHLNHPNPAIRAATIQALKFHSSVQQETKLIDLLKDEHHQVRLEAAKALMESTKFRSLSPQYLKMIGFDSETREMVTFIMMKKVKKKP